MTSPPPLQPSAFYHIYNRGTNRENIFVEPRNYSYFLQLYAKHIEPVAETYTYCLLKNHFHLLVKIKDDVPTKDPNKDPKGFQKPSKDPKGFLKPLGSGTGTASAAFSNFFNAYAKAINKAYQRTGSLFQHPFGRIQVDSQAYLLQLVRYIHRNPQKHGLIGDFRDWPYSSYLAIKTLKETLKVSETFRVFAGEEVLEWFNGPAGFIAAHDAPLDERVIAPLTPDDFD